MLPQFKRNFGGPPPGPRSLSFARPPVSTRTVDVCLETEPPHPIVAVSWNKSSKDAWRMASVAFQCRLDSGWGIFQNWKDRKPPELTNEHRESNPQAPQLN